MSPLLILPFIVVIAYSLFLLFSGAHYDTFKTLPVTSQLIHTCRASKYMREHRGLSSSCHAFVRSSSQHSRSNVQTHVSCTIHRDCWPISNASSAERENRKRAKVDLTLLSYCSCGGHTTDAAVIRRRAFVADREIGGEAVFYHTVSDTFICHTADELVVWYGENAATICNTAGLRVVRHIHVNKSFNVLKTEQSSSCGQRTILLRCRWKTHFLLCMYVNHAL